MSTTTIPVKLTRSEYPVVIGRGILASVGERVRDAAGGRKAFVLTNERVFGLFGDDVVAGLVRAGYEAAVAHVPDSEEAKSLDVARAVYSQLVASGHERGDPIVALGGGVVGDLAGFVAGTYMRGVPFAQVPTTLLAQVDSSVGGKAAVDLPEGKNLVGLFWQPAIVLADLETLDPLPARQVVAGLAEVVKAALLEGGESLDFVETHLDALLSRKPGILDDAVARSVRFKARVVEADETDLAGRAVLNLGHTTGHAIEQQAGFRGILHGEAVTLGLLAAAYVAEEASVAPPEAAERQRALVRRLGVKVPQDLDAQGLIAQMYRDKKASGGALVFVLLAGPGEPLTMKVEEPAVAAALTRMLAEERS
jgi:3-dehydroquinate synthase